ncbi:MAG: AbrB/MazE/SpoVT family DNA-binding domain-containing protein [Candidatus Magasanikiibacteriota bacterium]
MKNLKNLQDSFGAFHGSTCIGERGQLVIPKSLRMSLELKKGDKFFVMDKGGAIVLVPAEIMEKFLSDITKHIKDNKK